MQRKNIRRAVYEVLRTDEQSRRNDMYLTARVIEKLCGINRFTKPLIKRLDLWQYYGLPNYATIIRERRQIQVNHPELIDRETAEIRAEEEAEYRAEYGKKGRD